ncbi:hypothetical protein M407DRAFT_32294 [Tulasnella calospora MUT 4182]|uniref:Uncharacterized protein n=1 Tax=Tulasnella calospora MUT 4182 TaxID=1051891 RepID=A0A0C3PTD0_9AGAM|nr:hypothetical protein M407DRAFT_32294 [Tulasnella calospora MUT 4182]
MTAIVYWKHFSMELKGNIHILNVKGMLSSMSSIASLLVDLSKTFTSSHLTMSDGPPGILTPAVH